MFCYLVGSFFTGRTQVAKPSESDPGSLRKAFGSFLYNVPCFNNIASLNTIFCVSVNIVLSTIYFYGCLFVDDHVKVFWRICKFVSVAFLFLGGDRETNNHYCVSSSYFSFGGSEVCFSSLYFLLGHGDKHRMTEYDPAIHVHVPSLIS